jgi:hypothetical protein
MTSHLLTQRLYNQGLAIWGADNSPIVQQIKAAMPNAVTASGSAPNAAPPLNVFKPSIVPIRPAQAPAPAPQPAAAVSGDNPPEITM